MAASKHVKIPIVNFNAGLVSDMVAARIDIPQRASGGRVIDNFIPTTQGPIISRPGTTYCGEVFDSSNNTAYVGMNTASGAHYGVEISEYLFRFWRDGSLLTGSNISITSVGGSSTVTFTSGTSGVRVNWAAHGLPVGAAIRFTNSGGALPAGITAGTDYYVIANLDHYSDLFGISTTPYGAPVAYSTAGTGTHTCTHRLITTSTAHGLKNDDVITISGGTGGSPSINGTWVVKCINNVGTAISSFDNTTEQISVTSHGLEDRDRLWYSRNITGASPTGLLSMAAYTNAAAYGYSAIVVDANTLKFATGLAADNTAVTFSTNGSGAGYTLYSKKESTMTRFQLAPLDGAMEKLPVTYNRVASTTSSNCTHFDSVTGTIVANWIGKHTPFTDAQIFSSGSIKLGVAVLGDSMFFASEGHWLKKLTVNSNYDWDFDDYALDIFWSDHPTTGEPRKMPYYFDGPYEEANSNVRNLVYNPNFDVSATEHLFYRGSEIFTSGEEGIIFRNDCEDYSDNVRPGFGLITRVRGWTNDDSVASSNRDAEMECLMEGSPRAKWVSKWRKGLLHSTKGFARKVGFADDRMILGSFPDYPARAELSESSSYLSFSPTDRRDSREVLDGNGISIQMTAQSVGKLNWTASGDAGVFIGCTGGIYLIAGEDGGGLVPGGVRQTHVSSYGAADIPPIEFGSQLFYVEIGGKRIRVVDSSKGGDAFELSRLFFDSITYPIVSWTFAYVPYPCIWAVMSNGSMICVMVERQDSVLAGFTASLGTGLVKFVTTIKDANNKDNLYFLVQRTINGNTKRYIEKLSESPFTDTSIAIEDAVCSDCSYVYDGAAITNFTTELAHLAGATVDVVADGKRLVGQTVTAGGALTSALSTAASTIIVGLPYRPAFETLNIEATSEQGMTLGNVKRVNQVDFGFYRSLGGKVGRDSSNMNDIDFGSYTTTNVAYFSGTKKMPLNGDHTSIPRVRYEQTIPAPVCITYISPEVGIND